MQANVLMAFLLVGLCLGIATVGPRAVLRSPWPWAAAAVAVLLGLPYLLWQAGHGWPQLDVARGIAHGRSGSSSSRVAFLPLLLLEVGPWLLPIWALGLHRLWRDRTLRAFAAASGGLLVLFVVTGGKPYYLAGLLPLLLAAGAQPLLDATRGRRWVAPALLVLSTPALVFTLPVLPVRSASIAVAVNHDTGETIGWPQFADRVAAAYRRLPPGAAILTGNYGEAGAVDRYGADLHLPRAYSGHNGYAEWGAPPGSVPVLAIGVDPDLLERACGDVRTVGRLESADGIDNDENGTTLRYCVPRSDWRGLWPAFEHLG
jgi:hypothetical protein